MQSRPWTQDIESKAWIFTLHIFHQLRDLSFAEVKLQTWETSLSTVNLFVTTTRTITTMLLWWFAGWINISRQTWHDSEFYLAIGPIVKIRQDAWIWIWNSNKEIKVWICQQQLHIRWRMLTIRSINYPFIPRWDVQGMKWISVTVHLCMVDMTVGDQRLWELFAWRRTQMVVLCFF